jgi:hypothetical protein
MLQRGERWAQAVVRSTEVIAVIMVMMHWLLVGDDAPRLVMGTGSLSKLALEDGGWVRGGLLLEHPALPMPICVARRQLDADERAVPNEVRARITLCADASGTPLLNVDGDAIAYAAMLAEYMGVVADIINRTGLNAVGIEPHASGELRITMAPSVRHRAELREALWMVFASVKLCAHALGFVVGTMTTNLDGNDARYASAIKA